MRNVAFYAISICITSSFAANVSNTESHLLDLFNYKHYFVSDLYNPFITSLSNNYPVQNETLDDGYLLYGSDNQIIKFDKNKEILWIKKNTIGIRNNAHIF
jgi:hypothetical protein